MVAAAVVIAAVVSRAGRRGSYRCGTVSRTAVDSSTRRRTRYRAPRNTVVMPSVTGPATVVSPTSMEPATATAAGKRIIGTKSCTNEHNGRQNGESITKHDICSLRLGFRAYSSAQNRVRWR